MKTLLRLYKPLVDWYRENKRDLPWRHKPGRIPGVDIRDYAAADKGGSCKRILRPLLKSTSDSEGSRRSRRG